MCCSDKQRDISGEVESNPVSMPEECCPVIGRELHYPWLNVKQNLTVCFDCRKNMMKGANMGTTATHLWPQVNIMVAKHCSQTTSTSPTTPSLTISKIWPSAKVYSSSKSSYSKMEQSTKVSNDRAIENCRF